MNTATLALRPNSFKLLLSVGASICMWLWTCSLVVYVLSDPQRWAMTRYVTSLLQETKLTIPLSIPPPSATSVLTLQVDVDQSPLLHQEVSASLALPPTVLQVDSPVRLMGALSVQVMALDEAGCVLATASTRYRASGESHIQLPLMLIPSATPGCSQSADGPTKSTRIAAQPADRN